MELSGMRVDSPSGTPHESLNGAEREPSALSIMLSQNSSTSHEQLPTPPQLEAFTPGQASESPADNLTHSHIPEAEHLASETTPLIPKMPHMAPPSFISSSIAKSAARTIAYYVPSIHSILEAIPAVILGLLLNILDGVSYGMITFPAIGVFEGFGGTGVSMFFVTYAITSLTSLPGSFCLLTLSLHRAIVSQLVYSLGGSGFAGANGSMMIEVVVSTKYRGGASPDNNL